MGTESSETGDERVKEKGMSCHGGRGSVSNGLTLVPEEHGALAVCFQPQRLELVFGGQKDMQRLGVRQ